MLFKRFKAKTGNKLNNKKIEIEFNGSVTKETENYIRIKYHTSVKSDIIYIDDTIENRKSLKSLDDKIILSNRFTISSMAKINQKEVNLVKQILIDNELYKGYIDIITDGKYNLKSKAKGALIAVIDINFGQLQLFKRNKLINQVPCETILPF